MNDNEKENNMKSDKKDTIKCVITLFIVIVLTVLFSKFVVQPARVYSVSMKPTLYENNVLLINKFSDNYERNDIVVFKNNGTNLIKRLVGIPGDSLQIIDGFLYVNGEKTDNYTDETIKHPGLLSVEIVLQDNEYFLIGDNRNHSYDCRDFGPVTKDDLIGTSICNFILLK